MITLTHPSCGILVLTRVDGGDVYVGNLSVVLVWLLFLRHDVFSTCSVPPDAFALARKPYTRHHALKKRAKMASLRIVHVVESNLTGVLVCFGTACLSFVDELKHQCSTCDCSSGDASRNPVNIVKLWEQSFIFTRCVYRGLLPPNGKPSLSVRSATHDGTVVVLLQTLRCSGRLL